MMRLLGNSVAIFAFFLSAASYALSQGIPEKVALDKPPAVGASTEKNRSESHIPKFKSRSQLVLVPILVSRNGAPVTGLKKNQFRIFEDGKEQKISYFEEIRADSSPATVARPSDAAQNSFSNTRVDRSTPKRLVIIALDLINTEFEDRYYARQGLIKFLSKNIDDGALVSLVAIGESGVKVVHDFTSDRQVLVAALNKVAHRGDQSGLANPGAPLSNSTEFENEVSTLKNFLQSNRFSGAAPLNWFGSGQESWFRVRQTLDALNLIAEAYAGVPGRKSLIWATGGFPFQIESFNELLGYYEHTWRVMNQANIAIYPVDARGLTVEFPTASEDIGIRDASGGYERVVEVLHQRTADNLNRIDTLQTFANMTGGRAFYNNNDLAGAFRKAAADSASYYMVSYYMDRAKANEKKSRWHDLKVKVDVRGTEVRARSGFYSGTDTPDAVKNEIALALTSPLDFTALPLTVRWLGQQSPEPDRALLKQGIANKKDFEFEVFVPPNSIAVDESDANRMSIEVVSSARSEDGKVVDGAVQKIDGKIRKKSVDQIRSHGFVSKGSISLPPGSYSVRFVVRDNVGQRTGSVMAPLKVD